MKKNEYLIYGKKYLELNGFMKQIEFAKSIKKKFPIAKYRIFVKWMQDVNLHESHKNSKQTNEYYLNRLNVWLSPKK